MWTVQSLILTLLPIILILCMLIIWKKPADISGTAGWLLISIIAILFFKTAPEVVLRSTVAGLIKSFPVSLIVATSLLQMAYMEKNGSLKRIIIFIKTISNENRAVQIMMVNIGFGTLMVSVGATPVSLLPPILIALGYSSYVAIALPAIGYDALCTYALLGAPIVVFVDMANKYLGAGNEITLSDAGMIFYYFLPLVSTLIGFCMLWIVGKWKAIREGWIPCVITGGVIAVVSYFTNRVDNLVALTGLMCGLAVIIVMVLYLKLTGKKVIDRSGLTKEEIEYEKSFPLWKACMPWILLIVLVLALNLPKGVFNYLYRTMVLPIEGLCADGSPINTRALWNAYTWIFVSVILSMLFVRPTKKQLKDTMQTWRKRAPRPLFSAAIFFAIGEVMNTSGFDMVTKTTAEGMNMVRVLADASAQIFSGIYGGAVAFIGLFGGFLTGSEASAIAMFANYAMKTASTLGHDKTGLIIITASLAFGSGLASVISPAKLQNAAASIDKLGEENKVIRIAFVLAAALTAIVAIYTVIILSIKA
ncbi:L-lactate permease [Anaerobium acetethylicum]|uniref:L-lactate permease n=1 Tax=Anaerobium acetethylicum TaxID=1619234 RepID=A0A1D3TTS6_9FIRM|nr:L-lactate permease [Anaerobium acetethylicum]SCP97410.1 lactate permease [Anaerobium acetethylicum]